MQYRADGLKTFGDIAAETTLGGANYASPLAYVNGYILPDGITGDGEATPGEGVILQIPDNWLKAGTTGAGSTATAGAIPAWVWLAGAALLLS